MPLTPEELANLVAEYQEQADDGHKRLRGDLTKFHDNTEMALALLRARGDVLDARLDALARTPPDVTKLRFPTSVVVALIAFTASVVGAGYGFSSVVSGKIDTLSKRMDEQAATQAKIYEERSAAAQRSIDGLTRQMELLKYEQQRLREDVTGKKGTGR